MIQLPALIPRERPILQTLTELPFGSQTQVRVGDGQLAAFLAYAGCDRKVGTAKYALRVLNNTPSPAQARLFVEAAGVRVSAYPLAFDVAPFSVRDDVIAVRLDETGPYDRAIVHVTSYDGSFTVEAPPPERRAPNWIKYIALAAVPLVALGATAFSRPQILNVSAPNKAIAGSVVHVPFQISGLGTLEYDLTTRDGLQLDAGLASRSGVLSLQIPHDGIGGPYTLHLRMENALMKDEWSRAIATIVPPKPRTAARVAAPRIDDLAAAPSPVQAGASLLVRYTASAEAGDVWLIDGDGTTWAHAPLSPEGSTQFVVPKAAAGKAMRVVVDAQRAAAHVERSVALTVLPSQNVASAAASTVEQEPEAQASAPELSIEPTVASAGDTVTAKVNGVHGDVRVTMIDANGTTLAQGDLGEGGSVTMNAPSVTTPTAFFVVATFAKGVSQQTVMRRLMVAPR